MPWMKELAQLPTPTMATRTFSSPRPTPLVLPFAPLLSLMKLEVLLGSRWMAEHTRRPCWLQLLRLAAALGAGLGQKKLVPHMPHPLEHGDDRQSGNDVDRRRQQFEIADAGSLGEDQADRK